MRFTLTTRRLIVVLFATGLSLAILAGAYVFWWTDMSRDDISTVTDRHGTGISLMAGKSEHQDTAQGCTSRSGEDRHRELPDCVDIHYGPHELNTLDIWFADAQSPSPLVVYFHGGGFARGDKRSIRPRLLNSLLASGISVAAVNYRLSGNAPYPAQMLDAARALQFLRQHAAEFNIDPGRVGATGISAGGGIALWLAFHDDMANPASDDPVTRQSTRLSAAVVYETQTTYDPRKIMGLFNTSQVDEALIPFFGMDTAADIADPAYHPLFIDASPINHLTADDVPVMLYYSQADVPLRENTPGKEHIHHPAFGHLLKEKMDRLGIQCILKRREDYRNSAGNLIQDSVDFFIKSFNTHPGRR